MTTQQTGQAKRTIFLEAFAQLGTISHAAEVAGINRSTHYLWMEQDPDYRAAYREAEQKAIEALEREARRRAIEGVEEPVYHQGRVVGGVQKYSDTLLIFLLKGARPDKYRERVDLTVDIRREAERIAAEHGLEVEAVIAEAERIVRTSS